MASCPAMMVCTGRRHLAVNKRLATNHQAESKRNDADHEVYQFRVLNTESLSERQRDILSDIKLTLEEDDREQLRPLKHVERKKLRETIHKVNEVLTFIVTTDITESNQLVRAAAIVVTRSLGIKKRTMEI